MKNLLYSLLFFSICSDINGQEIGEQIDNLISHQNTKVYIYSGASCIDGYHEIGNNLISSLNKSKGLRNVILSAPPSYVYFFNKYIETKNDSILSFLLNNSKNKVETCKNRILSIINIINKIPEIRFLSIGYDSNDLISYCALNLILSNNQPLPGIKDEIRRIESIVNTKKLPDKQHALKLISYLKSNLDNNNENYKAHFGISYYDYKMIVNGLFFKLNYPIKSANSKHFKKREEFYYDNMKTVFNTFFNVPFIVFLDELHACKQPVKKWLWLKNWESLSAKLNNRPDSPFNNNVVSIIYYIKVESITEDKFYSEGILTQELRNELIRRSNSRFSVYNICEINGEMYDYCSLFDYLIIDRDWTLK